MEGIQAVSASSNRGAKASEYIVGANITNPDSLAAAKNYISILIREKGKLKEELETLQTSYKELSIENKSYNKFVEELKYIQRKYKRK